MKKTVLKNLQVILSEEEKLSYGKCLAKAEQAKIGVEERKKEIMDEFKLKLSQLDSEIGKKSRAVSSGYEYRDVDCEWQYDWKDGVKTLRRLDTDEVVEVEEISEYERQSEMKLAEEGEVKG